ncbi:hypothetical protein Acr_00g0049210 [Actinidia rufa]|uniref:Uncharacterized protein n=1 Tax=Actinidia rufa TaxID=165716 RepID=A0A7J0DK81_9ERIC|nr:hypothetical protein Acr_00g0049210 [Actinidia rufa]
MIKSQIEYWIQAVLTTCVEIERCSLHMHHARDVYGWRTTQLSELLAEDQSGSALQTGVEELSEFPKEIRRCCGERRLEGYTDWRGVSKQEELLSDMGPVVLARRMDKGSNYCTEVRKVSAGVLGGSVMVPRESGVVQEYRKMLWDMYGSLARHEWCNQCRMSIEKLKGRRSS